MNKAPLILALAFAVYSLPAMCESQPPAKLVWQTVLGTNAASLHYTVRQIVADGSGGCVFIYTKDDVLQVIFYLVRLDKKGKELWRMPFYNPSDLDIVYCDKKMTVVTFVDVIGNTSIRAIDAKGQQTTTSDTNADIYNNVNNAGEYGSPADKKGFFAIRFNKVSLEWAIVRHSYTPEPQP